MAEDKLLMWLCNETHVDKNVAGCCVSNYGNARICGAFNNSGCKKLEQCRRVQKALLSLKHN